MWLESTTPSTDGTKPEPLVVADKYGVEWRVFAFFYKTHWRYQFEFFSDDGKWTGKHIDDARFNTQEVCLETAKKALLEKQYVEPDDSWKTYVV